MPAVLPMIAAGVSIIGGIRSMTRGSSDASSAASSGAAAADPFASERPYYQGLLRGDISNLTSLDPTEIMKNPNFQFLKEQGNTAITNAGSAAGTLRSGNRALDLSRFNQGLATNFIQQQFSNNMGIADLMALLSGAKTGAPGAAGQIIQQGEQNATDRTNMGLNAIGRGFNGFTSIFGSNGGTRWAEPSSGPGWANEGGG